VWRLILHPLPLPELRTERIVAIVLGVMALVIVAHRPDRALILLAGLLPFHLVFFAQLYAWGMPAELVRPMLWWKELMVAGVVAAGALAFSRSHHKPDKLDVVGLAFVAMVGVYAAVPRLFSSTAPMDSTVRSQGFRFGALFVLLLLGARHVNLPADFTRRLMRAILIATTIVGALGIFEFLFSARWNDYLVDTAQLPRYMAEILNTSVPNPTDLRMVSTVGEGDIFRVGGVFANALAMGFYLVLGFAIAVEKTIRTGVRTALLSSVTIGGALIFTQTRAAILGGIIVCMLAFRPTKGRATDRRVRFAFIFAAGMVVALPVAASSGLSERTTAITSGEEESTEAHIESLEYGVRTLVEYPMGQGIGTSAGVGQRFEGARKVSENYYLQVGNEMGIVTMGAFVGTTLLALAGLRRAARATPDESTSAFWGALCGLAVGALLLHTWIDIAVAWPVWGGAGAVLGFARRYPRGHVEPDRELATARR
jgi:hypothetical protein